MLRRLGRELATSAEIRAAHAQLHPPMLAARSIALLCAAITRPNNQTLFWLVLARELQALALAVAAVHDAAGEAQRATALASAINTDLAPLTARLDHEHAAHDPDYAEARAASTLAGAGQPRAKHATPPTTNPATAPRPPHRHGPRHSI